MWKEITSVNDKYFNKLALISNSFGCNSLEPSLTDSNEIFIRYITKKANIHKIYYYEDSQFEIVLVFRLVETEKMYECIRCAIKWDILNPLINPKDALVYTCQKTKELMIESNLNVFCKPFDYKSTKDLLLNSWYDDAIISIYESLGIKTTRQRESIKLFYWLFELM